MAQFTIDTLVPLFVESITFHFPCQPQLKDCVHHLQ